MDPIQLMRELQDMQQSEGFIWLEKQLKEKQDHYHSRLLRCDLEEVKTFRAKHEAIQLVFDTIEHAINEGREALKNQG